MEPNPMNRPVTPPGLDAARLPPTGSDWLGECFDRSAALVALLGPQGEVLASNRPGPMPVGANLIECLPAEARAVAADALQRASVLGQSQQCEVSMARADGSAGWQLLLLSPTASGESVSLLGIDVTERKREELRLRRSEAMMVDTQGVAHLGVWEWDITQPHAVWSPELYRIYGLDPASHVPTYENYLTRVHPDDRQRVIDATNAAFHDHKPYSHDERIYRDDGELRYLHTWAHPVLDDAGQLMRLTGVCQDITDRALAESALVEHAAQLARVNDELEQFARLAAHDLQEPLRTVASFVQILERRLPGRLDAESQEAIGFIHQGVARMKAQIGDLLKYVKITSRRAPRVRVELSEALRRVQAELHAAIAESGAEIRHTLLPAVLAEPAQVDSLLRNLIDNAIKFSGGRRPEILITAALQGETIEVVVRDNGVGIEDKHQQRIFVVFQRLNPDLPGTGIGLAICKKIVDCSGGRIWVESQPGQGAAFHFTLPTADAHAA